MFLGEFSCLGVFYLLLWRDRRRSEPRLAPSQPFNPLLFLPPALCDMTGTSIMYVGECWGHLSGDPTASRSSEGVWGTPPLNQHRASGNPKRKGWGRRRGAEDTLGSFFFF